MGKQERNAKCSCGGGGKYKKCCMRLDEKAERISMFDRFAVMEDPRDKRGKRYGLIELLVMVVYGILNGYEDFENMADFLGLNQCQKDGHEKRERQANLTIWQRVGNKPGYEEKIN
jgi:hypothetical protein